MNLMMGLLASLGSIAPITVTNWGVSSGASPVTSSVRNVTVPAGNPGTIRFEIITNDNTLEYKKNAAAFAAVSDGGTLSVANGDAISFRFTGLTAEGCSIEVYDHTTGTLVGSWTATVL